MNNMDLLDLGKCYLCPQPNYLFAYGARPAIEFPDFPSFGDIMHVQRCRVGLWNSYPPDSARASFRGDPDDAIR